MNTLEIKGDWNITPLNPPKDPLLKHLHAPRQSRMFTELISQLQLHRLRGGDQTVEQVVRR